MHKKKFVVNKAALIFVMVSSFMLGFIFGDTNKSGVFFLLNSLLELLSLQ